MVGQNTSKIVLTYYAILLNLFFVPIVFFKAYLGPLPLSIEIITIPILAICFFIDYIRGAISFAAFRISPFVIAFAAYFIVSVISLFKAYSIAAGAMEIMRYLSYVFLFLIVVKVKFTDVHFRMFLYTFSASLILVALYGLAQYMFGFSLNQSGMYALNEAKGRVASTFVNPNYYAGFINFVLPCVLLFVVCYVKSKFLQIFGMAVCGILLINLILTYTRAGWVTFIGGLFLIFVFSGKAFYKGLFKWRIIISAVVIIAVLFNMPDVQLRTKSALHAMSNVIQTYIGDDQEKKAADENNNIEENQSIESIREDHNTEVAVVSRTILWKTGWMMFKENPMLGVGEGNYLVRYPDYVKKYPNLNLGYRAYSVHNSYLKILAETGILGLITFLSIFAVYYYFIARQYFLSNHRIRPIIVAIFAGSATYFMQNLTNNLYFIPQVNVIFWIVSGLLFNYIVSMRKENHIHS
ncbi:O-antigen ligase [Scopulibacillus daqui]|uniref:O-antigen ligase n=1 Tax=Scopulibacillus daqui TaxID=1469162 RepID=A0ABS2PYV1_9BACL|nr:O-antigen ligase family protein [Scopulibacillus daqui]MBM7645051.1 O-antigen ligase [Scopulibacillus daqui]